MTIEQRQQQTSALLLSPTKRRKIELKDEQTSSEPTTLELWKWTFKPEAIASCFIEDVLSMRQNLEKETDFFWLGRVPCRTVRIVGLVVGVQVYEKRIRYTVDDGTAVVDCMHRQSTPSRSPVRKSLIDVQTGKTRVKPPPPAPKPVARVGVPVCVVGRVVQKFGTRELLANSIEQCLSANDEPRHWLGVHRLHREHYSLETPFRIPQAQAATDIPLSLPSSPTKAVTSGLPTKVEISTPSITISTPSTAHTSPAISSNASSPPKFTTASSPQKLRHPSRLHSRDLTSNTFRIYVKHYMDRTSYIELPPESDDDDDCSANNQASYPATPTRPSRHFASEETPRPSNSRVTMRTPRPRIPTLLLEKPMNRIGFTLSYLRRVPELVNMAKSVVKAVTKRRQREERKKAKEGVGVGPKSSSTSSSRLKAGMSSLHPEDSEKLGPRVKRLFQATIVQLLREGSIVIWDGPVYSYTSPQLPREAVSGLWKSNVSSISADSTVFSAVSVLSAMTTGDDDEDLVLSEPESNEEAYIPLSPRLLAEIVESSMRELTSIRKGGRGGQSAMTKDGILTSLKKDDRWRYLSEWNIGEALDVLKAERKAYCVGKGVWELSI